jgi:phage-related protein
LAVLDDISSNRYIDSMDKPKAKPLAWIGSSKRDLKRFPGEVQDRLGFALYGVQTGERPPNAKPLKGFGGAGVLELLEDYDGDTYRAVYTVRFSEVVYMLHAFQKKAKSGIATPKHELEVVRIRLKEAARRHEEYLKQRGRA